MQDLEHMHSVIESILKILTKPRKWPKKSSKYDYTQYNIDGEALRLHRDSCFKQLRTQIGIGEVDLGLVYYYNPSIRGNSSSIVFFSANFKYAIKTIQDYEFQTLMRIADDYTQYIRNNPDSFLVRILGCYTLYQGDNKIRFIVMKNLFESINVKDIYDLKGHNLNRNFSQYIKKDKDWIQDKLKLEVNSLHKTKEQIKKDVEFLRSHNIMDYSLAISINTNQCNKYFEGVHVVDINNQKEILMAPSQYCMGIIDILTPYSDCKKMENWFNLLCLCSVNKSCKNPDLYALRFLNNVEKNVLVRKRME